MKTYLSYVRPELARIIVTFFIKMGGVAADLFLPYVLAVLLDEVVPAGDVRRILAWGGVMGLTSLAALACNLSANFLAAKTAGVVTERLRHDLYARTQTLSARQRDAFTVPSLLSRLTSDTYNVTQMTAKMQRIGFRTPAMLTGGLILCSLMDGRLTLVLVACMPFIILILCTVAIRGVRLYARVQQTVDTLVRCLQENLSGVRVIKALSRGPYERDRFSKINGELAGQEMRAGLVMAVTSPATTLILNAGLCLVVVAGAYLVNGGLSTTGTVIAFLTYFTVVLNATVAVSNIFVIYSKGAASAGRIEEVLRTPDDLVPEEIPDEETDDHIRFEDVSFAYAKAAPALQHVSFSLKRGQTLGILGPTGCGKTTLLSLAARIYDADSGHVRIDGRDVRSIPAAELRARFGIAFQSDFVMAATVRENIDFGRGLADEDIRRAAEDAQAAAYIERLPKGYDTELAAGGVNISGGQRQRLLVARALAARPEILVLDDASSALDYATDAALRHAIAAHYAQSTKIIVAQRVSSIAHADLILMLEDGEVVGRGTHRELMETCEEYRLIAETQLGEGATEYAG